jgi:hypothetical protein
LTANDLAIQVHGGAGYTREYDVEQHYRDNRLNAIHEGTHGIQSLDLLGRKVVQHDGASMTELSKAVTETINAVGALGEELSELAGQLDSAWRHLIRVTATLSSSGGARAALANSVIYLEAMGHIVIGWMWLEQLRAAHEQTGDFYDGETPGRPLLLRLRITKDRASTEAT